MAKTGPIEFLKQVRAEAARVTWPSRKETTYSTLTVFGMVLISAIFLFVIDQVIAHIIQLILG